MEEVFVEKPGSVFLGRTYSAEQYEFSSSDGPVEEQWDIPAVMREGSFIREDLSPTEKFEHVLIFS
jgi:hypothetical protein